MITIGEAFHRMDRPLVARRAMEWLGPGKCLALMGCNSVWTGKENWQKLAVEVIARWTKPKGSNSDHAQVPSPRPYREIFEEAGFVDVINQRFPIRHAWTLDSFIGYLYSTSVASKRVLGDHVNDFENDLRSELLKYDSAGCYTETLEFYYDLTRRPR